MEREKEAKSNETYKLDSLEKYSDENGVGYVAHGQRWYFNFANENAYEESDGVYYNFQEKVYVRNDGKEIYIQTMVIPSSQMKSVAQHMMDSFKLN